MPHTKKSVRWFRKRFLKGFYHIWEWRPSWSCDQHHNSMCLKVYIQNLVKNGRVVSEKKHVLYFIYKWPWAKVKK